MLSAARPRLVAIKAARPFSSTSYVSSDSQVDCFPTSERASSEHTSSPRPDRRRDYRDFVPRKPVPQNLTPGDYYTFKNGEWEESGPLPPDPRIRVVREPAPKTPTEKDTAPTDYIWRDNSWSATPEQKRVFAMRKNKSAERFPASFFPDATKAIRLTAPEGMEPIPKGVKKRTFTILPQKRVMRHIPPTIPRRPGVPESPAGGENEVVKAVQETKRKYIDSYSKIPLKTLVAEMVKRGIGKKGMKIEVVNKLERDDIANMVDRPYLTDAPVIVYPKVHSSVYKKAGWINHRPIPSNDRRSTDKRTFATLPSSIPKPTLQYSDPPIFPRLWTPPAETPIKVPHLQKYIPRAAAVVRPSIYPTERHHSEPPVLPKLHARPIEREIRVPFLFTYVGTGKTRPAVNTTVEGSNAVSAGTFGVNVQELVKPRFYSTMRPTSANASADAWVPAVLPKLHIMEPEKIVRVPLLPENVYAKYHRHEFVEKVMEPKRLAVLVVGADGGTSEVEEVALRERFGVDVRELIMTDEKEQEEGERECTIRPRDDDMGDQMTEEKRMWMKFLGLVAAVWYASGWGGC